MSDEAANANAGLPALEPATSELFRAAFRSHPAGVAVITADSGDGPVAMTVSSLASFSADPPMLVFSINRSASSAPTLMRAETVVVHFLGAGQAWLAKLGATSGVDRFADAEWSRLSTGEPVYADAVSWVRARVVRRIEEGSSVLFVLEALEVRVAADPSETDPPAPLVYHNRTWHRLDEASALEN